MQTDMEVYSSKDVARIVGLSLSHFRALMAKAECPKPETRMGHAYVWTDDDIARLRDWLKSRPDGRGRPRKDADAGESEASETEGN